MFESTKISEIVENFVAKGSSRPPRRTPIRRRSCGGSAVKTFPTLLTDLCQFDILIALKGSGYAKRWLFGAAQIPVTEQ
jgi:hypothetical protein